MRQQMIAGLRAFSRNRVIKKRLPDEFGGSPVFCTPGALLSMWKPGWRCQQARQLFEWARRFVQPADIVWDIGANQGLFSLAAAARAGPTGQVVAFEPDPFLAWLLHRSRMAQTDSRIDVLAIAVSGHCGIDTFCVARTDRALNHLATVAGNPCALGVRERFAVVTVTLDWAAKHLPPPDLIKIDVEGAELAVMRQAEGALLHTVRPRWIIEVSAENTAPIAKILRDAGYRMFDADAPEAEIERPCWNTLALPQEKYDGTGVLNGITGSQACPSETPAVC